MFLSIYLSIFRNMTDGSNKHPVDRTSVNSTTLASVGYDAEALVLELQFCNHAIYRYHSVPCSVYRDLLAADSKGKLCNQCIRPHFAFTRYFHRLGIKTI